jgi:hypothetical protein
VNLILILKIMGLAYVISQFAPLTWLYDYLPNGVLKSSLNLLTSCFKCCSFWLSLIMSGNIWLACFIYFLVNAISKDDTYSYWTKLLKEQLTKMKLSFYHFMMKRMMNRIEKETKAND